MKPSERVEELFSTILCRCDDEEVHVDEMDRDRILTIVRDLEEALGQCVVTMSANKTNQDHWCMDVCGFCDTLASADRALRGGKWRAK